jgi:hypothetical protein
MQDDMTEIRVKLRDPEKQLVKLICYIQRVSNPGHSFEVVVDPNDSEHRKSFFMDGDGPFFVEKVEEDGIIFKESLEEYLKKIQ